jgi:hypothetical protein
MALLTTLAMTTATAAYADPQRDYDRDHDRDRAYDRDRDRNHEITVSRDHYDHYGRSHWARDFRGRWMAMAQIAGTRDERQFGPSINNNRFRKIRVEAVRGVPMITQVKIEFENSTVQTVDMNTSLPAGAGEVIDLNGDVRKIRRVIVYTAPQSRGSYTVYGA